jgi:predicted nuclease with RNAse H fold
MISVMRTTTLGIDLSAQPRETACCVLAWRSDSAELVDLAAGFDDAAIVSLVKTHAPVMIAIDSPFGWPLPFTRAMTAFSESGEWPDTPDRRPLLFRTTDLVVREVTGSNPLSTSSNLLAICAMRCARLLTLLSAGRAVDRTGGSSIAEVYPAAALRQWGLDAMGYKGPKPEKREKRHKLVEAIAAGVASWFKLDDLTLGRLRSSDHLLDAFVSAVVGCAVYTGATEPIPNEYKDVAAREGWIHLPRRQPLVEFDPFMRLEANR